MVVSKNFLQKRRSAMTLVELLIGMGISSVIMLALGTTLIYGVRSYAGLLNYVDLDHRSRMTADTMTTQIRECNRVISFETNRIVLEDKNGGDLEFVHDPDARTLTRITTGETNLLLTGCQTLQFEMFQRSPVPNGDFTQYTNAGTPDLCKVLQVNWTCAREILGNTMNSESVQTAKIVLRNKL
jgi:hypothetical protein